MEGSTRRLFFAIVLPMRADAVCVESSSPARDVHSAPFASEWMTLSKQAHIDLVQQAHYFRALHERAYVFTGGAGHRKRRLGRHVPQEFVNLSPPPARQVTRWELPQAPGWEPARCGARL